MAADLFETYVVTVVATMVLASIFFIENSYTILNGDYEVIEAEILESSDLINKELKDSDLPDDIRIGSILRGDEFIKPSSNYKFQKNDIIVLLSKRDQLPTVENLFRISSI